MARTERLRCLVQPAALWIGVAGALVHIGLEAMPDEPSVTQDAAPSHDAAAAASQDRAATLVSQCRLAAGARCDLGDAVEPRQAVATAEEVLLGEGAADHIVMRFDEDAGLMLWTVQDFETRTRIDLDAFNGEVVAFERSKPVTTE